MGIFSGTIDEPLSVLGISLVNFFRSTFLRFIVKLSRLSIAIEVRHYWV